MANKSVNRKSVSPFSRSVLSIDREISVVGYIYSVVAAAAAAANGRSEKQGKPQRKKEKKIKT